MTDSPETNRTRSALVPIRSLGPRHRQRIAAHLMALEPHDRYLRFGYPAQDEQVQQYVDGLDFVQDDIFGIYNRKLELIAVAHLAFSRDPKSASCAEFGVSVLAKARGRGYGSRLFERSAMHARNQGIDLLFIHALSQNTAMIKIARRAGARVESAGAQTQAYLRLPPAALESRLSEIVQEQLARTDYRLKLQARRFMAALADLQQIRQAVRDGRHRSGS